MTYCRAGPGEGDRRFRPARQTSGPQRLELGEPVRHVYPWAERVLGSTHGGSWRSYAYGDC